MEAGSMERGTDFIHYFLCMIHPNEFNSGATLKFFDALEMAKRKTDEFYRKEWKNLDENSKKHHTCQCLYHRRAEEEPDEYRDNLENR